MAKLIFTNDIFFHNLALLRTKFYLSRRALGKLSGLSPLWIKEMEAGTWRHDLDMEIILRISQIFQVNIQTLLTEKLSK